jgi:hypothetical protein
MDPLTKLEELRTLVEKVEQKAHVPADHPDVIALQNIIENKLEQLEQSSPKNGG